MTAIKVGDIKIGTLFNRFCVLANPLEEFVVYLDVKTFTSTRRNCLANVYRLSKFAIFIRLRKCNVWWKFASVVDCINTDT